MWPNFQQILNIDFLYLSPKHVYVKKTQNKWVKKTIIQALFKLKKSQALILSLGLQKDLFRTKCDYILV